MIEDLDSGGVIQICQDRLTVALYADRRIECEHARHICIIATLSLILDQRVILRLPHQI